MMKKKYLNGLGRRWHLQYEYLVIYKCRAYAMLLGNNCFKISGCISASIQMKEQSRTNYNVTCIQFFFMRL